MYLEGKLSSTSFYKGEACGFTCLGNQGMDQILKDLSREDSKRKWVSLFGTKLDSKSIFPPASNILSPSSGKFSILIPNPVIDHNISLMASWLMGKFMGPRPNIEVVMDFVRKKWRVKGQVEVAALPKGFFSFSFSCKEDKLVVMCGGPWVIGKSSLAIKKWSPKMDFLDASFEVVHVWVHLPGLSLDFWNEYVFRGIASSFGELLSIDAMTSSRKRLVFSRIYLGITQSIDLPSSIEIVSKLGKWVQTVQFENLPFVCFTCKNMGIGQRNSQTMCPSLTLR